MDKIFSARTIVEKIVAAVRRGNIPRPPVLSCILAVLFITICYEFFQVNQQVRTMEGTLMERESQQDGQQEASQRRSDLTANIKNGVRNNKPILNPHPFTFTLNNPDKCKGEDVFLLIIVTTPPESQSQRQVIRETWGDESNIPGVVIRTIFAVGVSDNTQQALEDENETFRDIIQENFADTSRNATLKTIMYLKWALMFCPDAKYVMKTSPDVFVNIFSLVNYLKGLPASRDTKLLFGWVNTDKRPVRDPNSAWKQWHVAKDEFPSDTYPPYVSGFAYVMSNDMPRLLYETSLTTKYLFMEDVYLGICLEKLGIAPRHHAGFCPWFVEINSCKFEWLIVSRGIGNPEKMMKFWKALTSKC